MKSKSQCYNSFGNILFVGLVARVVSSEPITASESSASTRNSNSVQIGRNLSFFEKNNLFDHKISGTDIEEDEDLGIGGPVFTETEIKQAGVIGHPSQDQSNSDSLNTSTNDNAEETTNTKLNDSYSDTIMESGTQQEQSQGFFDGFEVNQQQHQPAGFFDGFEINDQTQQNPGFYDGFEISNSPQNTHNNMKGAAANYAKRAQEPANSQSNDNYQQGSIRPTYIYLFTALSFVTFVMFLCYFRDSIVVKRDPKKDQERINRLKNLYEGLDKCSTHILDDRTKLDMTITPEHSPKYSPRRLVAIHMGDKEGHTIEKIDFIDDIEFGECDTESEESLTDDMPALTMRMVRKNSGSGEHWIKYSSDEFTIDSDSSGSINRSKSDDSVPAL